MRKFVSGLVLVGCFAIAGIAQDPLEPVAVEDISMPTFPAKQPSPAQIREDTAQLQQLVQNVQPQLDKASQGVMDKDLLNKLKKIEKLAKKLREELQTN